MIIPHNIPTISTTAPALFGRGRFRLLLLALIACAVLTACASPAGLRSTPEGPTIQWPPPPSPATVEWVRSVESFRDVGISKGFWAKLKDTLTGGTDQGIRKPYGVLLDRQSRLIIVDSGAAVLHIMDMDRDRYTTIGAGPGTSFRLPIGVAEDESGQLYITDSVAGVVYRYDSREGTLVPFVHLQRPTGIAFNKSNGLLYVTDTLAHQIVAFDLNGNERLRLGGRGEKSGHFNYPTDLFIDGNGNIYVTDPLNFRIQIFTPEGTFLGSLGGPGVFSKPKGVATDSDGNIYVCDAMLDVVHVFGPSGDFLLDFGTRGVHDGEFWMPSGIHITGDDMIVVADTYNRRVQVFRHVGGAEAESGK